MPIHVASLLFAAMGLLVRVLTHPPTDGWISLLASPHTVTAQEAAFWRNVLGAAVLTPILLRDLRDPGSALRQHPGAHLVRGLLGSTALLLYFSSISLLGYSGAVLLCYTSPLFATLFGSLFLGEAVRLRALLGFVLAFGGITLVEHAHLQQLQLALSQALAHPLGSLLEGISGRANDGNLGLGVLCGLASGLMAGGAYTSVRHLAARANPTVVVAAMCWVGALLALPAAYPTLHWPGALECADLGLLALLANGGQYFLTLGYRRYTAAQASTMSLSVVVFAWLMSAATLHERYDGEQVLGLLCTLGGIALVQWLSRKPTEKAKEKTEQESSEATQFADGKLQPEAATSPQALLPQALPPQDPPRQERT